ncbi:MAG: mannose-6-phosphate isomerase, class I [Chitinophagaceae bacterium]
MQTTSKIFRLKGVVQHYSWGGHRFLPELLHIPNPLGQPFAEYWMGAHENASSIIEFENGTHQTLVSFVRENSKEVLGDTVNKKFGCLPYLFKILDVKEMLSIQVHPSKKSAVVEFEAENEKGIPVNDQSRNYKDDNHKPELMVALSDFWLLHGFKSPPKLKAILQSVPEFNFLMTTWTQYGYEGIYKEIMEMDPLRVNKVLQPLIDRILPMYNSNELKKSSEDFWAARAYQIFCKSGILDRGLFSVYFFNIVHLKPGEAIFQDAGILHAYLEGQNLEIMANSDNVLRGGLTTKKVDVPELLKHVLFESVDPKIIIGQPIVNGIDDVFVTPANDFELRRLQLKADLVTQLNCHTAEIFLVTEGGVDVREGNERIKLQKGECFFGIAGATIQLKASKEGSIIFKATVPE